MISAAEFLKWCAVFGIPIGGGGGGGVTGTQIQDQAFTYGVDSGVANAYVVDFTPAVTSLIDGQLFAFKAGHANTGASTIMINSLTPTPIVTEGNSALPPNSILMNGQYFLIYNSTFSAFVLIDSSEFSGTIPLTNNHIFVGNASNIAMSVAMSGDATIANTGILTLANTAVTPATYTVNGTNFFTVDSKGRLTGATDITITAETPYAVDTGAANAYVIALTPAPSSYTDGLVIVFKAANGNTGSSTINVNGLGVKNIVTNTNNALIGIEITPNSDYLLIYNSSLNAFVLINPSMAPVTSGGTGVGAIAPFSIICGNATGNGIDTASTGLTGQWLISGGASALPNFIFPLYAFSNDTGVANAYVATITGGQSGSYIHGQIVALEPNHNNTGASTINVNSIGVVPIVTNGNNALVGGEMLADGWYLLIYDSNYTAFVLINSSLSSGGGVTASQVQNQAFTYANDTGSPNVYTIALSPAITAYSNGQIFLFEPNNANTGASTLNVNSLGTQPIVDNQNNALVGGEIILNHVYMVIYNSIIGKFVLVNSSRASITEQQIQQQAFTYAVDSGAANAYVVTLNPAVTSYTDGMYVAFQATNANSGATTIDVNAIGAQNIVTNANAALVGGEILVNGDYLLMYNSSFSAFVIINSSLSGASVTPANIQKQSYTFAALTGISGGGASTGVMTLSPAPSAYTNGMIISFFVTTTNASTVTINVNGLGAKNLVLTNGSALSGSELIAGEGYFAIYTTTGGHFTLLNSAAPLSTVATKVGVQQQSYTFASTSGVSNAFAMTLSPAPASYVNGMYVCMTVSANGNTGAATLNVNSLGTRSIVTAGNNALVGGELTAPGTYILVYDSAFPAFILLNPANVINAGQSPIYGIDSGSANSYVLTLASVPSSYIDGERIVFKAINANTGASTININSIGLANIVLNGNTALVGGEILANGTYDLEYNSTYSAFVLINPSTGTTTSNVIPSGSAISLTNNTPADVTSISVPPGKWLIVGNVSFTTSIANLSDTFAWISTTSASLPDASLYSEESATGVGFFGDAGLTAPSLPFTFSTTTTVYLSTQAAFASGTVTACGGIYAIPV